MRNFWAGVIVFIVILFSIWIQFNVLNIIPLFGVKANIGIILTVALSTLSGQGIGMVVGVVFGLFFDVVCGKAFGIYILLYFFVGFFCGKMSKGFSKENKSALVMIVAGTTLVFEILSYFIFVIVSEYEFEIITILKTVLLEILYNIFITRVFFKLFSNLSETINKGKQSYYLL